jgi:hypothetical protein
VAEDQAERSQANAQGPHFSIPAGALDGVKAAQLLVFKGALPSISHTMNDVLRDFDAYLGCHLVLLLEFLALEEPNMMVSSTTIHAATKFVFLKTRDLKSLF